MTSDPRQHELEQLQERSRELAATHQELRTRRAEVSEYSAEVHEEAARVHEEMGDAAVLKPADLRAHAEADRRIAAEERAGFAEDEPRSS